MDNLTKEMRSKVMSLIKCKDTKIEVLFRKELWKNGIRYRKNLNKYFGKPDIVLKKYQTVIFLDSCFWHGCPDHLRIPSSNKDYWNKKIQRNTQRDCEVNQYYQSIGWKIIRIWEHEIKYNRYQLIADNLIKDLFKNPMPIVLPGTVYNSFKTPEIKEKDPELF